MDCGLRMPTNASKTGDFDVELAFLNGPRTVTYSNVELRLGSPDDDPNVAAH
jgi:hypothetical protein